MYIQLVVVLFSKTFVDCWYRILSPPLWNSVCAYGGQLWRPATPLQKTSLTGRHSTTKVGHRRRRPCNSRNEPRHYHTFTLTDPPRHSSSQSAVFKPLVSCPCLSTQRRILAYSLKSIAQIVAKIWYVCLYDTRCYFNVRSKADISRLNLPHENDN